MKKRLVGTTFEVSDNSGAKRVQCIRLVDKKLELGCMIQVSIQKAKPGGKVTKGEVRFAIIVELKKPTLRADGNFLRYARNAVVLVNEKKAPIGTRILGSAPFEVRAYNCSKFLSIANQTV